MPCQHCHVVGLKCDVSMCDSGSEVETSLMQHAEFLAVVTKIITLISCFISSFCLKIHTDLLPYHLKVSFIVLHVSSGSQLCFSRWWRFELLFKIHETTWKNYLALPSYKSQIIALIWKWWPTFIRAVGLHKTWQVTMDRDAKLLCLTGQYSEMLQWNQIWYGFIFTFYDFENVFECLKSDAHVKVQNRQKRRCLSHKLRHVK